jgi:hypothetical protein
LGFVEPLTGIVISFICLGLMLYKHVNLGITLNATGLILAFLTLNWAEIPRVIWSATDPSTLEGQLTIAVVMATFGIMWLSQLYKETGALDDLSRSLGRIIKNSKIVLSALPAVIGLLPVAGGALMSAPIVDSEADKIKMKPEMKAYVNRCNSNRHNSTANPHGNCHADCRLPHRILELSETGKNEKRKIQS